MSRHSPAAENMSSDSSASAPPPLVVPPPEEPWAQVALARALYTEHNSNTVAGKGTAAKASVTAPAVGRGVFAFPYALPTAATAAAAAPPTEVSPPPGDAVVPAEDVFRRRRDLDGVETKANAVAAALNPSTHATATDFTAAVESYGQSRQSRSRGSSHYDTSSSDNDNDFRAVSEALSTPLLDDPNSPSLGGVCSASAVAAALAAVAASNPSSPKQQPEQQDTTYTDLFVGLEMPRLHRLPRAQGSLGSWNSTAWSADHRSEGQPASTTGGTGIDGTGRSGGGSEGISTTSRGLLSLVFFDKEDGMSLGGGSATADVAEDEAGAHTSSVYCGPQLPHWWRTIVTPSVGMRVCLRPNTARLEFWWIDQLGSEAYEMLQVILRYRLEGLVMRDSGEAAVVVEFHVPAAYLGATSLAVWHTYEPSMVSSVPPPTQPGPSASATTAAAAVAHVVSSSINAVTAATASAEASPLRSVVSTVTHTAAQFSQEAAPSPLAGACMDAMGEGPLLLLAHLPATIDGVGELTSAEAGSPSFQGSYTALGRGTDASITVTREPAAEEVDSIMEDVTAAPSPIAAHNAAPGNHAVPTEEDLAQPETPPRLPGLLHAHDSRPRSTTLDAGRHRRGDPRTITLFTDGPVPMESENANGGTSIESYSTLQSAMATTTNTITTGTTMNAVSAERMALHVGLSSSHETTPLLSRSRQRATFSTSTDTALSGGYGTHTSISIGDPSRSAVTVAGRHLDPFLVEHQTQEGTTLTQVLDTNTAAVAGHRRGQTGAAGRASPIQQHLYHNIAITSAGAAETTAASIATQFAANLTLHIPVTSGKCGYSPRGSQGPWQDASNNTSSGGDNSSIDGHVGSAAPRLVAVSATSMSARRSPTAGVAATGNADHHDFGDLPSSSSLLPREESTIAERSVASGLDAYAPSSQEQEHHTASLSLHGASSVADAYSRNKTYGEWLHMDSTTSLNRAVDDTTSVQSSSFVGAEEAPVESTDGGVSPAPARAPRSTSPASMHGAAESDQQQQRRKKKEVAEDEEDDDVVVRLTLPTSVCVPVIVMRLHAHGLLHPLLKALTVPYSMPTFTAEAEEDTEDGDADGTGQALLTATQASPLTSDMVQHIATPDYATALKIITVAIDRAEAQKHVPMSHSDAPSPTGAGAVSACEQAVEAAAAVASTMPAISSRDLSVLYTIRSHLHFHASATHLYDSLSDVEAALAACPTEEHLCSTYEILGACLLSFGHSVQVERVAAHLRHCCQTPSTLLLRLGRVTQVMVSYASIFLHQQVNIAFLRYAASVGTSPTAASGGLCRNSGGKGMGHPYLLPDVVQSSPLDDHAFMGPYSDPNALTAARVIAQSAMPLVVVGGGIVDPPTGWGRSVGHDGGGSRQRTTRNAAAAGGGLTNLSAVAQATFSVPHRRTLSYEVCPLLLGYYGKSLHRPSEGQSVVEGGAGRRRPTLQTATAAPSPVHPAVAHKQSLRLPSSDVCHRRLFLLETLFPSVLPRSAVNGLQHAAPTMSAGAYHGTLLSRTANRSEQTKEGSRVGREGKKGNGAAGRSAQAKAEKLVKPEDFMYDRDSMFALLASSTETVIHYGTVAMRYFARHIRLSATRSIPRGETVLLERPAMMLALWPPLPPRKRRHTRLCDRLKGHPHHHPQEQQEPSSPFCSCDKAGREIGEDGGPVYGHITDASTFPRMALCCDQCGRQRFSNPVWCPGGCGSVYCSDSCRRLALGLYHVIECGGVAEREMESSTCSSPTNTAAEDTSRQVRAAVGAMQDVFASWHSFLCHFANYDTPSTRGTVPFASRTPPSTPPGLTTPTSTVSESRRPPPPPILAMVGLRAMSRLVAMMLATVVPIERLPQLRGEATVAAARQEKVEALARTLHFRGLTVAPRRGTPCGFSTTIDPHRLLLLEAVLQQLSIPFFADFTYRAPATVWEAMRCFPCEVRHAEKQQREKKSTTANARPSIFVPPQSPTAAATGSARSSLISLTTIGPKSPPPQQRRYWFVELTERQREELMCETHYLLEELDDILHTEMAEVMALPVDGVNTVMSPSGSSSTDAGYAEHWRSRDLVSFLANTRAFEELLDFCLTSCAVVYPHEVEPSLPGGGGGSGAGVQVGSGATSPTPSTLSQASGISEVGLPARGGFAAAAAGMMGPAFLPSSHGSSSPLVPPPVPLAVISPWTCLTVDVHPIIGHVAGGLIYSRFMVEHEQRRRMIAYCAAAAARLGTGGGGLGASGYGSGMEDSFLSIHSMASASAAAVLGGHNGGSSPSGGDEYTGGKLAASGTSTSAAVAAAAAAREDWTLKVLEEAASRSCANLHLSLVYSPAAATGPSCVAVLVTAKKTIQLGEVLWWESENFGEYLYSLF